MLAESRYRTSHLHGRRKRGDGGRVPRSEKVRRGRPPRFENDVAKIRCLRICVVFWGRRILGYFGEEEKEPYPKWDHDPVGDDGIKKKNRLTTLRTIRPHTQNPGVRMSRYLNKNKYF